MKGILVSTLVPEMKVVEVEDKLETFYELLYCNKIDIVQRKINGLIVTIVCNDEGTNAQKMPTAISRPTVTYDYKGEVRKMTYTPMLFGDILIVGDGCGSENLVGLGDDQIEFVKKQGVKVKDIFNKSEYEAIINVDFV